MADIKNLRKLLSKATPGPWTINKDWLNEIVRPGERYSLEISGVDKDIEDAELIATLRNEVPALLDRLEAMEANARRYEHLREYGCWLDPSKYAKAKRVLDAAIDADIAALRGKVE